MLTWFQQAFDRVDLYAHISVKTLPAPFWHRDLDENQKARSAGTLDTRNQKGTPVLSGCHAQHRCQRLTSSLLLVSFGFTTWLLRNGLGSFLTFDFSLSCLSVFTLRPAMKQIGIMSSFSCFPLPQMKQGPLLLQRCLGIQPASVEAYPSQWNLGFPMRSQLVRFSVTSLCRIKGFWWTRGYLQFLPGHAFEAL